MAKDDKTRLRNGSQPLPEKVPCAECHKEIPPSQVYEPESEEYAMFFCGLECFEKWHERGEEEYPPPGDGDDSDLR
jgi:hypothetical protein